MFHFLFPLQKAIDYGGPRKEFFQLALNAIEKKFFNMANLRDYSKDYFAIGRIMCKKFYSYFFLIILCYTALALSFWFHILKARMRGGGE